jgi:cyclohexyl-isocyanide hydratase
MTNRLTIGTILFPEMDQIDFTGPFEVLSRIPRLGLPRPREKHAADPRCERLDSEARDGVGGCAATGRAGRSRRSGARDADGRRRGARFPASSSRTRPIRAVRLHGSVAVRCGRLARGVRATTHWSAFELLPYFGAIPVDERVVSAAGVTAGLDGALRLVALLRGDAAAQRIQLAIQYAPEPPFQSGSPSTAPAEILAAERERVRPLTQRRSETARRVARRLAEYGPLRTGWPATIDDVR